MQGRARLLGQPTAPARPGPIRVRVPHGPTLISPASAHSLCGFSTSSLFPSLRLQITRSLLVLLKPCLAGKGAVNPSLSQESCSRLGGRRAWGCSCPGPRAGPRDIFVLKHPLTICFFSVLYTFWSPIFINTGVLLGVHFVPQ